MSSKPESSGKSASQLAGGRRDEPGVYPEDLRELVERYLGEIGFSDAAATAGLEEAMRYSLLAGGSGSGRCSRSRPPAPWASGLGVLPPPPRSS